MILDILAFRENASKLTPSPLLGRALGVSRSCPRIEMNTPTLSLSVDTVVSFHGWVFLDQAGIRDKDGYLPEKTRRKELRLSFQTALIWVPVQRPQPRRWPLQVLAGSRQSRQSRPVQTVAAVARCDCLLMLHQLLMQPILVTCQDLMTLAAE